MSIPETVAFRAPRFARVRKGGDIDYVTCHIGYGPKRDGIWLTFMFGGLVGGHAPEKVEDSSMRWEAQTWTCPGAIRGREWLGRAPDGRRSRHVAFPFGFAAYTRVPPKAAAYFDKILATACCAE